MHKLAITLYVLLAEQSGRQDQMAALTFPRSGLGRARKKRTLHEWIWVHVLSRPPEQVQLLQLLQLQTPVIREAQELVLPDGRDAGLSGSSGAVSLPWIPEWVPRGSFLEPRLQLPGESGRRKEMAEPGRKDSAMDCREKARR